MKHAGPQTLDRLEPLLAQIRAFDMLKEKSRGCFYLKSKGFLHFHEHGEDEIYADIGLGAQFDRLPAMTQAQHRRILALTAKTLKAAAKPK